MIHWSSQFSHHVRYAAEILEGRGRRGGAHADGREGRGVHAGRLVSMLSTFSLPADPGEFSLQFVVEQQGHPRAGCGLAPCLLGALNDSTISSDHPTQDAHATSNSQRGGT